jgi:anti-sigma regulatory factor (Ser/Thr protein kinase)
MLEVPDCLDSVAAVRSFLDSIDLTEHFLPERIFDMKVAVSEAVANAIEHAKADVRIWIWLMTDRVVVEIANEGEFGPGSGDRPREQGRGYGLKLMVSLADEVTFARARRGQTKVRLTFLYRH